MARNLIRGVDTASVDRCSGVPPRRGRQLSRARVARTRVATVRQLSMGRSDWTRLKSLPWGVPLTTWPEHGVRPLVVRQGESRHSLLFLESGHRRYAIKERSPWAAAHESAVFEELRRRGCRTLEPVGHVVVHGEAIVVGEVAGYAIYESGDTGYCVTRLAERVLPQSILYGYPFTTVNKRLLW